MNIRTFTYREEQMYSEVIALSRGCSVISGHGVSLAVSSSVVIGGGKDDG